MTNDGVNLNETLFETAKKYRGNRQKPLIEVIDDDEFIRNLAIGVLRPQLHVVSAEDGPAGIEIYNRLAPDLVFLDIHMPEVDGLQILAQLFKLDKDAKVIMFSARSTEENINAAMKMGAKSFITKPFSADVLISRTTLALRGNYTG